MQILPHGASTPPADTRPQPVRSQPVLEEAVYRMVTLGAILLVLGSLWAF